MAITTEIQVVSLALNEVGEKKFSSMTEAKAAAISLQDLYDNARDETLEMYPWRFARARTRLTAAGLLDASSITVTFADADPDTIVRSSGSFLTDGFKSGERVTIDGSVSNNKTYLVDTAAALTLTLESSEEATAEVLASDSDLKLYANPTNQWDYKYAKDSDMLTVLTINERFFNGTFNGRAHGNSFAGTFYQSIHPSHRVWKIEGNFIVTNEIDTNDQIAVEYTQSISDVSEFSPLFIKVLIKKLAALLVIPLAKNVNMIKALNTKADQILLDGMAADARKGHHDEVQDGGSWISAGRGAHYGIRGY